MRPSLQIEDCLGMPEVRLVRAIDVDGKEASGCLSREEARSLVERATFREEALTLRAFLAAVSLGEAHSHLRHHELVAVLSSAVDRGEVMALREGGAPRAPRAEASPASRLLNEIQAVLAGGRLRLRGEWYDLVRVADLPRLSTDPSASVVSRHDAEQLLSANEKNHPARLLPLLAQACALVAATAREAEADGLALVRRRRVVTRTEDSSPPSVTPSQLRAQAKSAWVEIVVTYEDGTPYAGTVQVTLASGTVTGAQTDSEGVLRLDGIPPGTCEVTFPDLDASAWRPVAATPFTSAPCPAPRARGR